MLIRTIIDSVQINLHLTDLLNDKESDIIFQHNCLYAAASNEKENNVYQIISYCMSELPTQWNIQENNFDHLFTFAELYKQNITSQQLYIWSAPIDIIERYQLFLNQLPLSMEISMSKELYYNCTLPRFGPICQYEFDYYKTQYSSLNEMINNFYHEHKYQPNTLTCYIHLKCNRGTTSACLDWSEICDGKIDCLNGGHDEEYCWQLKINECNKNEYRCANGQCIPLTFFRDDHIIPDCLDGSDEILNNYYQRSYCNIAEPTIQCEDIICRIHNHMYQTSLTSSCVKERTLLLLKALFSSKPNFVHDNCWQAFKCLFNIPMEDNSTCLEFCQNKKCENIIQKTCPHILNIVDIPILFDHVHFIYTKNDFNPPNSWRTLLPYICYNDTRCDKLFENNLLIFFNNTRCIRPEYYNEMHLSEEKSSIYTFLMSTYKRFWKCNYIIDYDLTLCNRPNMYLCINSSKCISIYRLKDGIGDCYFNDDEKLNIFNEIFSFKQLPKFFKCTKTNISISYHLVDNGKCDCSSNDNEFCEDEYPSLYYIQKHISFQTICDGFTELLPIIIDGQNHTDETECEQWFCNNIYTHCDGIWHCLDGADEINCDSLPLINCSLSHHICVSSLTNQLMCLPIDKANDGNIDCLGATDEPKLCRSIENKFKLENFYCHNDKYKLCISYKNLCNNYKDCEYGDDEQACDITRNFTTYEGICHEKYRLIRSNVENFLCTRLDETNKQSIVYFSLNPMENSIKQTTTNINKNLILPKSTMMENIYNYKQRCHRGLDVKVWLDNTKNLTTRTCLCPPIYYGNLCQYQNQRVSLTLQFQTLSDSWQIPFVIIISLIDNSYQRKIHSYQQLNYLPMKNCQTKFHIYLLYSYRPKDLSKNYSIHIDIYEKISLTYRVSFLVPIMFPFLPVNRLALQFTIPYKNHIVDSCSKQRCFNGRCINYFGNHNNITFCQCYPGWSGQYCTIRHHCMCSSDSLCFGSSSDNRSICVCPINKFGSRCMLNNQICQLNANLTCLNGGQCISFDQNLMSINNFKCICPKGYSGDRCEIIDNKIILSFDKDIILPQIMLIHFIEIMNNSSPKRSTTFKTLPTYHQSLVINWSHSFHIVLIEFLNKIYYLTVYQKKSNQSIIIVKKIQSSDRCQHINEIFNDTMVKLHLLRRIKYYHLVCQRNISESYCFYDDIHICLCDNFGHERQANCFEFDHQMKFDCVSENRCENGAQCYQNSPTCPQTTICVCPTCFYGRQCQFSTSRFGFSLDPILGYKIQPYISIKNQPIIVQVTFILTILMTILGFISGILSIITFKNRKLHEVGCGIYLLSSSISSLLTMIMFALKFSILLGAQMEGIINRSFLYFQCITIDFFLRISLNMDHWLNACVASERAITSIRGAQFNKRKSKKLAKYVIISLLILMISTTIHDPLHRRLIDDVDENGENKRIWCIVSYSSSIEVFNSIINVFHFFVPFFINLISTIIIIKSKARQKAIIQPERTHRQHLNIQFQKNIHLLIAPILLVILALPRLIISFASGCMKSVHNSWLFVTGYFLSFIPSMLTFILFILPNKSYKAQFGKTLQHFKRKVQMYVQPIS
ncbi:unnamed protein product [Rotaria sp. Silwood1]|nr:unnamed protein product [Rotaria sp. Silwood1]